MSNITNNINIETNYYGVSIRVLSVQNINQINFAEIFREVI